MNDNNIEELNKDNNENNDEIINIDKIDEINENGQNINTSNQNNIIQNNENITIKTNQNEDENESNDEINSDNQINNASIDVKKLENNENLSVNNDENGNDSDNNNNDKNEDNNNINETEKNDDDHINDNNENDKKNPMENIPILETPQTSRKQVAIIKPNNQTPIDDNERVSSVSALKRKLEAQQQKEEKESKEEQLIELPESNKKVKNKVRERLESIQDQANYRGWKLNAPIANDLCSLEEEMAMDVLNRFEISDPDSIRNKDAYLKGIIHHVKHEWAIGKCGPGKTPDLTTPPEKEHIIVTKILKKLRDNGTLKNPIDMRIRRLLSDLPEPLAYKVMEQFEETDFTHVNNPNGFLRSLIRMAEREKLQDPSYRLPLITKNRLDYCAEKRLLVYGRNIRQGTRRRLELFPEYFQLLLIRQFEFLPPTMNEKEKDGKLQDWIKCYENEFSSPVDQLKSPSVQTFLQKLQNDNSQIGVGRYGYCPPEPISK